MCAVDFFFFGGGGGGGGGHIFTKFSKICPPPSLRSMGMDAWYADRSNVFSW